jgi:hypothetical protein
VDECGKDESGGDFRSADQDARGRFHLIPFIGFEWRRSEGGRQKGQRAAAFAKTGLNACECGCEGGRVGDLRASGAVEADSSVWIVRDLSDSRLHFSGDDDGGGAVAAKPARRISARRVVTGSGAARSAEMPAKRLAPKNIPPSVAGWTPNFR